MIKLEVLLLPTFLLSAARRSVTNTIQKGDTLVSKMANLALLDHTLLLQ
ncbi:hypothetical protein T12_8765 [Trichinella patagoniensis]|uniref:Uncharacterized protein n=1 Tax=Trichinella patagoniensis TaxID=990121 RepID=A0A0V0YSY8_9BILA|nr:hypothetical protein T12_8765 [Trichinella patagoniensis]